MNKARDSYLTQLAIITISILVLMTLLRPGLFLSARNFSSMAFQFPEFAILALALMLSMLTGGIDLSVVSTAILSATTSAVLFTAWLPGGTGQEGTLPVVLTGVAVSVSTGLACGLVNGWLVAKVGISPILATLGTMQLYSGAAFVITGGTTLIGFPDQFVQLGNSALFLVPIPLFLFLLAAGTVALILNRTVFGEHIYLFGANPVAACFAGIRNPAVLTRTYVLSGFLSSIAGIIMMARTNSVNPDYGSSYLLLAILVAVLGGVNPTGGFGKVSGLILAVLALQFLSSGLNMLRFSSFSKELVWGALLLLVMAVNAMRSERAHVSQ
jgi:simple sugar transport system permease protein